MKRVKAALKRIKHPRVIWALLSVGLLAVLFLTSLGSLTGGITPNEYEVAKAPIGWQGIYQDPLYASLKFFRSVVFYMQPDFGQFLLRLSNVFFGALACVAFYFVVRSWHSFRVAFVASLLFATSAFTLHVTRLASYDVMYLSALPLLLFGHLLLRQYPGSKLALLFTSLVWLHLISVPGLIWLVLVSVYTQRKVVVYNFKAHSWLLKSLYGLLLAGSISLLTYLLYLNNKLLTWIGLPDQFAAPLTLLKQFVGVFVHMFIRGPQYPEIWLGKAPILDIFCWAMCLMGIYFYAKNKSASRTKAMTLYMLIGVILVALGGPVSIALLVPLLYLLVATGITYMRHEWLKVFPVNPIARNAGMALLGLAIILSCTYNLRAYFVAWPHNEVTQATFSRHL